MFVFFIVPACDSNMDQDIENYESWYTAARFLWVLCMKYYEDTNKQLLKSFSLRSSKSH